MTKKINNRRSYRLGEMEELFDKSFAEAKEQNPSINASTFMRFCLKKALENNEYDLAPEVAEEMINALFKLTRELAKIGGNLNQIAHYFNIHERLNESDLRASHEELQERLKDATKTLNELMNEFRESTY